MINKKIKAMAFLVILLVIVCKVVSCGEWKELPPATGPHAPTEPAPPIPYSEVTKVSFSEIFGDHSGGRYLVGVTATKGLIWFRCIKEDVLREHEQEFSNRALECGESTWKELLSIFEDSHVNTWTDQGYYLDQTYNQQATLFVEWPEVEFVEEGDFFNVADNRTVFDLTYLPRYYGIDQNERKFRSDYYGSFELYTNNEESPSLSRSYKSYGLPKEYNRFRKELWDFIVGQMGIPDWRLELGDWGRENLYKKYPYMLQENQERQIRYFSFLENYGGKGSAMGISLVYDGGEQSISYECYSPEKIYSVDKSGLPVLYCERNPVSIWKLGTEIEVLEIPEGLPEIIERYEVGDWETEEVSRTGYVRQGEFYNIENAEQVEDKNEQVLRSGYDALLHVVYTDGDHVEIRLENGQLPEEYNDFRGELWDYILAYINEGKAEDEQAADWRDLIDQWGEEYLCAKYPYKKQDNINGAKNVKKINWVWGNGGPYVLMEEKCIDPWSMEAIEKLKGKTELYDKIGEAGGDYIGELTLQDENFLIIKEKVDRTAWISSENRDGGILIGSNSIAENFDETSFIEMIKQISDTVYDETGIEYEISEDELYLFPAYDLEPGYSAPYNEIYLIPGVYKIKIIENYESSYGNFILYKFIKV